MLVKVVKSRVGRKPIELPKTVQINVDQANVKVKGPKGELSFVLPVSVDVKVENQQLHVISDDKFLSSNKLAGTTRAILNNHVIGVTEGFIEKLQLHGVGYRAQVSKVQNKSVLNLTLGLSHPVSYIAPEGIEITCPTVTEIIISGTDKQLVGQAAANIQGIKGGIRRPDPYKGKGIRYVRKVLKLKEAKKKK